MGSDRAISGAIDSISAPGSVLRRPGWAPWSTTFVPVHGRSNGAGETRARAA